QAQILVYNLNQQSRKEMATIAFGYPVSSLSRSTVPLLALNSIGQYVAVGIPAVESNNEITAIKVWRVSSQSESHSFMVGGRVLAIALSDDGKFLATGNADKTVTVWDVTEAQEVRAIITFEHLGRVTAVAMSPDERFLATGSDDDTARVWDIKAQQ